MVHPSISYRRHLPRPASGAGMELATLPGRPSHRPSRHCPALLRHAPFIQVPYRLTAGFAANADYASLIRPTTGIRLRARNGGGAVLKRQRNYCGKKALLGGEHWDLTGEGSTAKAAIGDDGLRLAVGVAVGRNQATGPCRPWQTNRARGHKSECPAPRCG